MIYIYLDKEIGKFKGDVIVFYEDSLIVKVVVEWFDGRSFRLIRVCLLVFCILFVLGYIEGFVVIVVCYFVSKERVLLMY